MQTTLLLATLASSALASHVLNAAPAFKRDLQAIAPRQTDSAGAGGAGGLSEECQSAALGLLESLPTPAPEIQSDLVANTQTEDPCSFSTPSSLSKEYASYSSELMSWYSDKQDDIESALSACSDLASLGGDMLNVCSTELPAGLAGADGADATKTTDESSKETGADGADGADASKTTGASSNETTGSSSSSDEETSASDEQATETSTGGAARETGMAVAAIAAVVAAVL